MKFIKLFLLNCLLSLLFLNNSTIYAQNAQEHLEDLYKELYLTRDIKEGIDDNLDEIPDESATPAPNVTYTKIAILGNSSQKGAEHGFNQSILRPLLKLIKAQNPKAVFFTGNLVYGLKTDGLRTDPNAELLKTRNMFGRVDARIYGKFDAEIFKNQLAGFSSLVKEELGTTPFYPLPGEHEAFGPTSLEIFSKEFNITPALVSESASFAYTVAIDNAFFTLFGTDNYDNTTNQPLLNQFNEKLLPWLNTTLNEASKKYNYSFVLGNDPAFSTESVFGYPQGIDQNLKSARQFWKALKNDHVTAYFSSSEILYDRSFQRGVWQIISGGAGATAPQVTANNKTFYHYLLLYIPQGSVGRAYVEVYDVYGTLRDRFTLTQQAPIIHALRISVD